MSDASSTQAPTIEPARPRRPWRWRRWLGAFVVLLLLYAAGGFVGVPWVASRWIVPAIDDAIGGTLRIDRITCNPFTATIELGAGALTGPDGAPILTFDGLRCDFDPLASLASASWRFAEVTATRPSLDVRLDDHGTLNLLEALSPPGTNGASNGASNGADPAGAAPAATPRPLLERIPRLRIAKGRVIDASLRVEDRWIAGGATPFTAQWSGATLDFGDLDLAPLHRNQQLLSARASDGASMEWQGALVSEPPSLRGILRVRDLPIAPFMPYLAGSTTARITAGTLDFDLRYELAPTDEPPVARLDLPTASLSGVRIMDGETILLDGPQITLVGTNADISARRLVIPSLRMSGAELHLVRDADGRPALLRLFPWAAAEAATQLPTAPSGAAEEPGSLPQYPVERVAAATRAIVRRASSDWDITVASLALHDQVVRYRDLSTRRPVEVGLRDMEMTAGPVRSAERFSLPFDLAGTLLGGGTLRLTGFIRPLDTELEVRIDAERVALAPFAPYMPEKPIPELGPLEWRHGVASGSGTAGSRIRWSGRQIQARWEGRSSLEGVRIEMPERAADLAAVRSIAATGLLTADISPEMGARLDWKGRAHLDGVSVDAPFSATPVRGSLGSADADGELLLHHSTATGALGRWKGAASVVSLGATARGPNGAEATLEIASLGADGVLQAEAPPDASTISASHEGRAEAGAMTASLIQGGASRAARWERASIEGVLKATRAIDGVAHAAGEIGVSVRSLHVDDRASLPDPIHASLGDFSYRGTIEAAGGAAAPPDLRFAGVTSLVQLAAAGSHPRVGPVSFAGAKVIHDGAGRARAPAGPEEALVQLSGRAEGEGVRLETPELDRMTLDVAKWNAEMLDVDLAASRASLDTLGVHGAHATIARTLIPRRGAAGADGASADEGSAAAAPSNGDSARRGASTVAPTSAPIERTPLFDARLAHLRLDDAALDFIDTSTDPPATHSISGVRAEVDDLATRGGAPTRFEASGLVNDAARFEARGSLHPFDLERATTVDFTLTALALDSFDPYSGRFVGHDIESGRLTIKLPVSIDRSVLKGNLDATLDRFYLGREVPSDEAPDLPIKLGLDLLRDSKERIAVSLPFSGDLHDPDFALGGVVWQAVVNLLLKATTAPFTLLGALVGAGDRDLSLVVFEPGSADLPPETLADLDLLAKALAERPAIGVRAIGSVVQPADSEGLRRAAFRGRLRTELGLGPGDAIPPEALEKAVDRAFRDLPRAAREAVEKDAPGGTPTIDARERAVCAGIEVDPAAIAALARARADEVAKALVRAGVPADRVVAEAAAEPVRDGPPRVIFDLK